MVTHGPAGPNPAEVIRNDDQPRSNDSIAGRTTTRNPRAGVADGRRAHAGPVCGRSQALSVPTSAGDAVATGG